MYLLGEMSTGLKVILDILGVAGILVFGTFVLVFLVDLLLSGLDNHKGIFFNRKSKAEEYDPVEDAPVQENVMYYQQPNPAEEQTPYHQETTEDENVTGVDFDKAIEEQKELMGKSESEIPSPAPIWEEDDEEEEDIAPIIEEVAAKALAELNGDQKQKSRKVYKIKTPEPEPVTEEVVEEIIEEQEPVIDEEKLALERKIAELEEQRKLDREELLKAVQELKDKEPVVIEKDDKDDKKYANIARMNARLNSIKKTTEKLKDKKETKQDDAIVTTTIVEEVVEPVLVEEVVEVKEEKHAEKPRFKKDYYENRLTTLENELKEVQKELKANNKEYQPLVKVKKAYDRDSQKLRRKEAQVAKQKVSIYGVNKAGKITDEKRAKLDENVKMLKELKDSVFHCEQVINKNKDRFPILEKNNKLLTKQVKRLQDDIASVNEALKWYEENNE